MFTNCFTCIQRCWMAPEVAESMQHSESSDVFAAGMVLHYILAKKRHPFAPEDNTGVSDAKTQNETEGNILSGHPNISKQISAEACHLLEMMLQVNKTDRPTAENCLNHPFFWSQKKKIDFFCAVANQKEFKAQWQMATPSKVVQDLELLLGKMFDENPWDESIPLIFLDMGKHRRYVTSSAADLVRFIRNAYQHVSDAKEESTKRGLLEQFVFSSKFPTLFISVYKVVKNNSWDKTVKEIGVVIEK